MQTFNQYLAEATVNSENVRHGIIQYINDSLLQVSATGGMAATIQIGKHKIQNVVAAKPSMKTSSSGIFPYVDIDLILSNSTSISIGLRTASSKKFVVYRGKGLSNAAIPAFYKGIHSLDKVYPEIREHFISSLLEYYTTKGYTHGSTVDTVYGKIVGDMKETVLLGDKKYGGKVDYIIAIDRAPMMWKKMKIPTMSAKFKGNEYIIKIGNARAFSASDIMANNDVYLWAGKRHDNLYLGNDKVDQNNLPAIFGPSSGDNPKDFGIKRYRVGVNISTKESFNIEDHTRIFKLELKNLKGISDDPTAQDAPTTSDPMAGPGGGAGGTRRRKGGKGKIDTNQDRKDYGTNLSPDEREEIIHSVMGMIERGMRHRFKIDIDKEQEETILADLEKMDDHDLKRLVSTPSHRLAAEIKAKYL